MASTAPARTNALHMGRRLLSRSSPSVQAAASTCLSHDVVSSSLAMGDTSVLFQQSRPISSMGRLAITPSVPPTYSALRNKVTMPFDAKPGQPYVSPYGDFFASIEAGRTSLGTTEETEQRVFDIQEQRLECGIPESELRFQTTSYGRFALPPYVSPGEHRVTVKVSLSSIPFDNEQEKEIFLEIVGSRFNPKKGYLQLSSEKFASRIENKRYLVDMIEKIVGNASKLAKEFILEDGKTPAISI